MEEKKKKIVIIGGGVSGLTAGIYALDNGFDVEIYEKHVIAGGECTGWYRDNIYIDGCAHWIVGTNPKSDLFPLWTHIGAFDENTKIYKTEYFTKFDFGDETCTIYANLEKFKNELLRISKEDENAINEFVTAIEDYEHVRIPVKKPLDLMNIFELTAFGFGFLPVVIPYLKYKKTTTAEYADRFKSPILRKVFKEILSTPAYNAHSFFYVMQALVKDDAGMVEGGSLKMVSNIVRRYKELGGKLYLNSPVQKIIVDQNVAKGILLENGNFVEADYVISSCDTHFTLYNLLEGKYKAKYYEEKYNDREAFPLNAAFQFSYKVKEEKMKDALKMVDFYIEPFNIDELKVEKISSRNHYFDKTISSKDGCTTVTVLVPSIDSNYDYLKSLSKEEYSKKKEEWGNHILNELIRYYKLDKDDIKLIDVTTPLTYERYCNAYRGSYMSFIATDKNKSLMDNGIIKGLKNFVMCGQWLMPPGGLPIALFTGKNAAYRICYWNKQKFINKESRKAKFYLSYV